MMWGRAEEIGRAVSRGFVCCTDSYGSDVCLLYYWQVLWQSIWLQGGLSGDTYGFECPKSYLILKNCTNFNMFDSWCTSSVLLPRFNGSSWTDVNTNLYNIITGFWIVFSSYFQTDYAILTYYHSKLLQKRNKTLKMEWTCLSEIQFCLCFHSKSHPKFVFFFRKVYFGEVIH